MKLRHAPRTPEWLREEPRINPDEIQLRTYGSNVGVRYIVEARHQGRSLGDRAFATLADAQAFAKLEAGWHQAKLVDKTRG
jgi:hypothetical protein